MDKIDRKLYTDLKELLSEIKIDFGGGCSLEKAYIMAWYQGDNTVNRSGPQYSSKVPSHSAKLRCGA